jgi:hypothetical protein
MEVESARNVEAGADLSKDPIRAFVTEVKRLRDEWREKDKKNADCRGEEFIPTELWFRGVDNAAYCFSQWSPLKLDQIGIARNLLIKEAT